MFRDSLTLRSVVTRLLMIGGLEVWFMVENDKVRMWVTFMIEGCIVHILARTFIYIESMWYQDSILI